MADEHYSASRLIHVFIVVALAGAAAIVVLTSFVVSNDDDLWLNLASEAVGVLVGGSLVAYLFERILRREEHARREHELARVSRGAALLVNETIGRIAIQVAVYLTRPLDLRAPAEGEPLREALRSLADQLADRLERPWDDVWDPHGGDGPRASLSQIHADQMSTTIPLLTGIVRALTLMRTSVVPLLQAIDDIELLTLLSAAESDGAWFDELVGDWQAPGPNTLGPRVAIVRLPELLRRLDRVLGIVEARTGARFLYERPLEAQG